jgi:hypothetical protein
MLPFAVLAATLLPAATLKEDGEKAAGGIKGTWRIFSTTRGPNSTLIKSESPTLTVGEKELTWDRAIPLLWRAKGKGALKVDGAAKPPTIELKVGEKVYKGIYRIKTSPDDKEEYLEILLSEAGGEAPKEFDPTSSFRLPKGFKGALINSSRKK